MFRRFNFEGATENLRIFYALILLLLCMLILAPSHQRSFCSSATDFTLTDVDGSILSLGDFLGQVVVLDFFATWCHPCMEEIPILRDVKDQFPQGLALISISVDPVTDTVENLLGFRNDYNVTIDRSATSTPKPAHARWNCGKHPACFVFTPNAR